MNDYQYPSPAIDGTLSRTVATLPASSSRHCHRQRHSTTTVMVEDEMYGDPIKCTGKSCKSCTAGLIADCVAVCCCCPCAVVNILVFAFLKVPWMVGRRILKLRRNNRKKKKCCGGRQEEWECGVDADGISRKGRASLSSWMVDGVGAFSEFELPGFGEKYVDDEELKEGNFSARFEAEQQLWFELHQVGHLGFGRVSFTGIPIPCG